MQEIAVEGQALVCALLGVELGCKNIIACNGGGKARPVFRFTHAEARIRRPREVAVHEIEVAAVGHAVPKRVRLKLPKWG